MKALLHPYPTALLHRLATPLTVEVLTVEAAQRTLTWTLPLPLLLLLTLTVEVLVVEAAQLTLTMTLPLPLPLLITLYR